MNWVLFDKNTFSLSADFYNVDIDDRIVLSGNIDSARISNPNNEVRKILSQNRITSLNFFTNAINTRTAGADINISYNHPLSDQTKDFIEVSIASNIALKNEIRKITDAPPKIASTGINIFNRKEQARLLTARPSSKTIIGIRFVKEEKFDFALNGIYFGSVLWKHQTDSLKDQSFSGKWVANLSAGFRASKATYIALNINNLLNVKPDSLDTKGDPNTNGGGRYRYYREVNQFGYIGRSFLLRVTFSL
jgi:iron complex outermembrane receptor protein